ncbi:Nucleotidyl transferase family protein [Rhodopirellula maiorica SM1]|uniref:Nucleotidyl transferase family protein n=1 Tax=Rhodopirellula maiorica SM1 TaxID=1265738 RepID=M5REY2_9BACT|nr:nucleotidyltransferase family protein [Rhodopirellula maiorica]EMI17651.1 Nucleotidyl transferase family protein [Rhodopirellula maiorica SM1]
MQAVILAGGLGTRLWPLTKTVPKPMVPIAGTPYLEHQLRLLQQQSITDIVLLTGYLSEQIEEHFGDGSRFGISIAYSKETTPLGTGGALRQAAPLLQESFLVIYGDSYLPIQYAEVLDTLANTSATGAVTVYDNQSEDTGVTNNIALDDGDFITKYKKDAPDDPLLQYVEAGVLAFKRSVLQRIPEGQVSLEQQIFPLLISERGLVGHITQERFYDIGTPERLERIAEQLA